MLADQVLYFDTQAAADGYLALCPPDYRIEVLNQPDCYARIRFATHLAEWRVVVGVADAL